MILRSILLSKLSENVVEKLILIVLYILYFMKSHHKIKHLSNP